MSFLSFLRLVSGRAINYFFCSLWGGCSQAPLCVSYRPCFEGCPRIWYFARLQILGLRSARTRNLRGSQGFKASRCMILVHVSKRGSCQYRAETWNTLPRESLNPFASATFLFAELDEDERVYVHLPEGVRGKDGSRGFLHLKKACMEFEWQHKLGPDTWRSF